MSRTGVMLVVVGFATDGCCLQNIPSRTTGHFWRMKIAMTFPFCVLFMACISLGGCWQSPPFCYDYECPVYSVVNTYEGFEERLYNTSQWITTDIASSYTSDILKGLWKLNHFMQGQNKDGKEITMTRPVLLSMREGYMNGDSEVSISFFIPADIDLPEPNDESINFKNLPPVTVYVRTFGGLVSVARALENVERLKEDVEAAGVQYDGTRFEGVVYDALSVIINRHNEVWIYAE